MAWFRRKEAGIRTNLSDQNEVPEGLWTKCQACAAILNQRELDENLRVCPKCSYHFTMSSLGYFNFLFDNHDYTLFDEDLLPVDALDFVDKKRYNERLLATQEKTNQADAARSAIGLIGGHRLSTAAMDFSFIGGSMGSVVGEVVARSIRRAYTERIPLLVITQSGGARMMEGALSLMQMAKTSAHLTRLAEAGLPYIVLLTNPTTGGVTASFAMLGDFHFAEPGALIGFAGPRVIRETMGQDLPPTFQRAEFLQEKGFVDRIVDRRDLRQGLIDLLNLLRETPS